MNTIDYFLSLAIIFSVAAALDSIWLGYVRPALAIRFHWPEVRPDERIPKGAWIGAAMTVALFIGGVGYLGTAAGL